MASTPNRHHRTMTPTHHLSSDQRQCATVNTCVIPDTLPIDSPIHFERANMSQGDISQRPKVHFRQQQQQPQTPKLMPNKINNNTIDQNNQQQQTQITGTPSHRGQFTQAQNAQHQQLHHTPNHHSQQQSQQFVHTRNGSFPMQRLPPLSEDQMAQSGTSTVPMLRHPKTPSPAPHSRENGHGSSNGNPVTPKNQVRIS